jgi:hypothetical protein
MNAELCTRSKAKLALCAMMLAVSVSACNAQSPAPAAHPQHAFFHVSLGDSFGGPVSGDCYSLLRLHQETALQST